jgi:hypothetical protein
MQIYNNFFIKIKNMPSYRPLIARDEYHYLEFYYFRLVKFTETTDFWNLTDLQRGKITSEISYMSMTLHILGNLFNQKGSNEKPVIAWLEIPENEKFNVFYRFSCISVASKALGCNQSKISAVCKGLIKTTGGYMFKYEEKDYTIGDYEK